MTDFQNINPCTFLIGIYAGAEESRYEMDGFMKANRRSNINSLLSSTNNSS